MTGTWREWRFAVAAILILAAIAAKGLLIQPPAVPAHTAAGEFDTARAMARLDRILGDQRPHPVDSAENDAVRTRLMAEIAAVGLQPQVREATDCSGFPKSRTVSCSHVRNVVAVMPGGDAPALLLNVHYDSTPTGPGAADDGIGVAALLEIAHLLRRERLARPVILLFNEGEEFGLNGAALFAESDPLARQVGRLINIEARGVSGPAFMFETSEPNASPIAAFKAASRRPFANSISSDFARLIPNSTDVVKFKPKGWEFLSFAIIGNETRYHSPGDNLDALDRASLYHMGSQVFAATRQMAAANGEAPAARSLFMDVGGIVLLTMPFIAGATLLGALTIGAGMLASRRRAWQPVLGLALAMLLGVAAAAILTHLAGLVRAGDYWRAWPWVTTLAVSATVLAVEAWLVGRIAARHDRSQLRLAAWTVVIVSGVIASFALPGAIIFFVVGPTVALTGVSLAPRWHAVSHVLVWAGAIIQLFVLTELVAQIELTLIDGPLWAIAPLVALAALPILAETGRGASRTAIGLLGIAVAGLWLAALLMPRASAARPLAFTLDHVTDARSGKSYWAAATKQAPLPAGFDLFGPWRSAPLPYNRRVRWQAAAPSVDALGATATIVESSALDGARRVRVRLDRGRADALLLRFDEDTSVLAMGLPARPRTIGKDADNGQSILRCTGRSCDGLEVEVLLGTAKQVTAMLVAQRFTPAREAAPLLKLRPANAHPQYSPDSQVEISAATL